MSKYTQIRDRIYVQVWRDEPVTGDLLASVVDGSNEFVFPADAFDSTATLLGLATQGDKDRAELAAAGITVATARLVADMPNRDCDNIDAN